MTLIEMTQSDSDRRLALRGEVRAVCARFGSEYWQRCDRERAYPEAVVQAVTDVGFLAALIPSEYGGLGLGIADAAMILEEINRSGGNSGACHAQMYTMGALLRHGSERQKRRYLPEIAAGRLRLQAFSITEPEAGTDTTDISTTARREGDDYVVNGHKNWTSRIQQSDLLMLLARTTPRSPDPEQRTQGISLFLIDLRVIRAEQPDALEVEPVRTMINYATNQVWYRNMRIPAEALIGQEGAGFRYVLDGMNAERILIASESVGDGYFFLDRGSAYARERVVFGRPIGSNQGVQFPLARAYAQVLAADLVRCRAAELFDAGEPCGAEANTAKLLSSEAAWAAGNACIDTYGGNGFVERYDVERKFRETRIYQVAPINNNMVLAFLGQRVLGLPRSY